MCVWYCKNIYFLASSHTQVLITKIRSSKSAETHNYKKATKALLVLIPLLGITFCLDMINPSSTGLLVNIYKYAKVAIISTQVNHVTHGLFRLRCGLERRVIRKITPRYTNIIYDYVIIYSY